MRCSLWLLLLLAPSAASADTYSIFHPRPEQEMREMSTDRPDTTESPISIDAGHVQVELDLLVLGFDQTAGVKSTTTDALCANLKLGLTDRVDLQLVVAPLHRETIQNPRAKMQTSGYGYGGTTARVKANLWGNDGGTTAGALLPFVGYGGGAWTAGLAIPIGLSLPGGFESAVMPQITFDELGTNTATTGMLTATASHDLFGPLGAYAELAGMVDQDSATAMQADGGLTLAVSDNVQLDLGTRVGVSGDVPDIEMFAGLAARR